MEFRNTQYDRGLMGCGNLYAIEASKFNMEKPDVTQMVHLGFISEGATFTRTHESTPVMSANLGQAWVHASAYSTVFDTNIFSYSASNISRFLTGAKCVKTDTGCVTYFATTDTVPETALVFLGHDDDTNNEFMLVMPRCSWQGDYELDFNDDDPVALNYQFACLDVTMPNGKTGAAWIVENYGSEMPSEVVSIPDAETKPLEGEIKVSDMISDDTMIKGDGRVVGTLKYVASYPEFSVNKDVQKGNYMPFTIEQKGRTMTIAKNGVEVRKDVPFDPSCVFRVTEPTDTFTVSVDGDEIITLSFAGAVLAKK